MTTKPTHSRQAIVDMLGRTLGADKAAEIVNIAATQLGAGAQLDRDQTLAVLELIAQQSGIVGIAARFAKSRVHLVWDAA